MILYILLCTVYTLPFLHDGFNCENVVKNRSTIPEKNHINVVQITYYEVNTLDP